VLVLAGEGEKQRVSRFSEQDVKNGILFSDSLQKEKRIVCFVPTWGQLLTTLYRCFRISRV